jgi:hypothetical protein
LPHEFLAKVAKQSFGVSLPPPGKFAAGIVFLPTDAGERERCKSAVAAICAEEGQTLVGWRAVPTNADAADLGHGARGRGCRKSSNCSSPRAQAAKATRSSASCICCATREPSTAWRHDAPSGEVLLRLQPVETTLLIQGMLTPGQL